MAVTLVGEFMLLFQMACVIFLFAYLFSKSRFYTQFLDHKAMIATQVFLAIAFGLLSVYGMSSGISFYTANVNIRDFGPIAGGFACGPFVGIGAGIIGFAYRLVVGGTNVYAVAIGPLAAGIIGGLVYQYNKRELVPTRTAVIITFIAESLISTIAIVVRILAGDSFETWTTVTVNVAVPMILMTTLAVAVFCIILQNEKRERRVQSEKIQLELEVESKRNLATIINTIAYPVYVLDRAHRFTVVNDSLCRFIGSPREVILGRNPRDFFPQEDAQFHWAMTEDVFSRQTTREDEVTITKPDGQKCTLISTEDLYTDASGQVFMVGVIQDITDRKIMQVALAENEAWYRTLFEHTGTATLIIDENSLISQVNSEAVKLTGYSREEIEGKMSWKDFAHPDDLPMVKKYHRERIIDSASAPTNYTVRMRTRNGEIKTLQAVVALIPGTKKSIASYGDISEQKKSEDALKLVNRKLNLLSSITRHDIINQILILKGFLALLRKMTGDPVLIDYIDRSKKAILNIEHQIIFTRDYQDMGVKAPVWQNVKNTIIGAKGALPMGNIAVGIEPPELEIFADPLFEKVFLNLIDNSLKYGGERLRTIRVSSQETKDGLDILYEDDGAGVTGEDREHIFERGYGKHTGFGLFLSREILSITGISIEETGQPAGGARFTIHVPRDMYRYSDGNTTIT